MSNDMKNIDAGWAWSAYEPSADRPWNRQLAAHLFRRAGFAGTPEELDQATAAGPGPTVSRLLAGKDKHQGFDADMEVLAQSVLATGDVKNLPAWWLYRLLATPHPLLEKMTIFWHGHFATSAEKVRDAKLMYQQNQTLRRHALGDFAAMVHEVSRDPAMLIYLDSTYNRKAHPNENYARELMELFCLGEGNYSENDVRELARCFTGWEVKQRRFRFNRFQHDAGQKTILGRTGDFPDEQAVDVVIQHPTAPRFIIRKLFRYFICDEPSPPEALIEPLAEEFRERHLQIGVAVERILRSRLFFSDLAVGRKIKSPVEHSIGLLRALNGTTNVNQLALDLAQLGQSLFFPPNVKGWDGGRTWINSSTLLARANVVHRLLHDANTRFGGGKLDSRLEAAQAQTPEAIVDWLHELLFAVPIGLETRRQLVQLAADGGKDRSGGVIELVHVMCALPEFQLA
jgi:hypothetical protein